MFLCHEGWTLTNVDSIYFHLWLQIPVATQPRISHDGNVSWISCRYLCMTVFPSKRPPANFHSLALGIGLKVGQKSSSLTLAVSKKMHPEMLALMWTHLKVTRHPGIKGITQWFKTDRRISYKQWIVMGSLIDAPMNMLKHVKTSNWGKYVSQAPNSLYWGWSSHLW